MSPEEVCQELFRKRVGSSETYEFPYCHPVKRQCLFPHLCFASLLPKELKKLTWVFSTSLFLSLKSVKRPGSREVSTCRIPRRLRGSSCYRPRSQEQSLATTALRRGYIPETRDELPFLIKLNNNVPTGGRHQAKKEKAVHSELALS